MKNRIKVGSKVVIKDSGNTYTTYGKKFEELNFNDTMLNQEIPNGTICEVFAVTQHSFDSETILVAVQDFSGKQALISLSGVSPVEVSSTDDKFDLLKDFCDEFDLDITSEDIFKYLLRNL